MMRVQLDVDGVPTTGSLLSSPNVIGVCKVRVLGEDLQRFCGRLKPLDDEARTALAYGDRFVSRDPDKIMERALADEGQRPHGWSIADLEMLLAYAQAAYQETEGRGRLPKRQDRKRAMHEQTGRRLFVGMVRLWLKQSRMISTAREANLSEEESRDPIAILQASKTAIARLSKMHHEATGVDVPLEIRRLVSVISNYLTQYAKPADINSVSS